MSNKKNPGRRPAGEQAGGANVPAASEQDWGETAGQPAADVIPGQPPVEGGEKPPGEAGGEQAGGAKDLESLTEDAKALLAATGGVEGDKVAEARKRLEAAIATGEAKAAEKSRFEIEIPADHKGASDLLKEVEPMTCGTKDEAQAKDKLMRDIKRVIFESQQGLRPIHTDIKQVCMGAGLNNTRDEVLRLRALNDPDIAELLKNQKTETTETK